MKFLTTTLIDNLYQPIEYLESSGTQYIDLNYIPNVSTKVISDLDYTWTATAYLFGAISTDYRTNAYTFSGNHSSGDTGYFRAFVAGDTQIPSQQGNIGTSSVHSSSNIRSIEFTNTYVTLDGTTYTYAYPTTEALNIQHTMFLFARNNKGTADYLTSMKIYSFKIWDNSGLVRDLQPVKRTTDNVLGMYDKVNKFFYTNAGTGDFVGGNILGTYPILPKEYTELEYVESTGTQYIDSGVYLTDEHSVGIDFQLTATGQKRAGIFGGYCNTSYPDEEQGRYGLLTHYNTGSYEAGYGKTNVIATITTQDLNKHTIYQNKNVFYFDGVVKKTFNAATFSMGATAFIGGFNYTNYTPALARFFRAKIRINNNTTLIRDFVPAKRNSDGEIGYYDLVNGTFYTNAGTGSFIPGREIKYFNRKLLPMYEKTKPYQAEVEYLESTGTQYINTGYCPSSNTKIEAKFKMNETPNNFKWLFLSRNEAVAGNGYGLGCDGSGYISSEYNNRQTSSTKLTNNTDYIVVKDKNVCKINDITLTNTVSEFTVNYPLTIFALNDHGNINTAIPKANLYYFKIYENNVLVRDYIPVLDWNDRPCLYDKVEGKCYYNEGTDEFIAGSKIIPIEYLECTTTATQQGPFIDTKIPYFADFEVGVKVRENVSNKVVLSGQYYCLERNNEATGVYRFANGMTERIITDALITQYHTIKWKDNKTYIDDEYFADFNKTSQTGVNLTIFGYLNAQQKPSCYPSLVYHFKAWDTNGNLIRDMIPVRDENNNGYMFDKISHTLYGNAGTGSFALGDDVIKRNTQYLLSYINDSYSNVPSEYKRVRYLQSNGTQYIDTGIKGKNTLRTEITLQVLEIAKGTAVFGTFDSNESKVYYIYQQGNPDASFRPPWQVGMGNFENTSTLVNTDKHTFILDNNKVYLDGNLLSSLTEQSFSTTRTLLLFNMHKADNTLYSASAQRLYSCKMIDAGVVIRNFIPVVRLSDNKPGLYDSVTGNFYTNAGTGEFIVP